MNTTRKLRVLCFMLICLIGLISQLGAVVPAAISSPYPANGATNVSTTLPQFTWQYVQGGAGAPTGYYVWLTDYNHSPSGFTYKFEMYGKMYFLSNSATTWSAAQAACAAAGGKMASAFSAQMQSLLLTYAPTSANCWLGLSDAATEGTWVWEDGQPYSYTHWYTGEPNDAGGNEDYVELMTSGVYNTWWNDANGLGNRYYFLELPGRIIHSEITGASSWDLNINLLPNHNYRWRIEPYNADGKGPSTEYNFTTAASGTAPVASSFVSPVSGATGTALNPTLTWNSVAGAEAYKLYVWKARNNPDAHGNSLIGVYNGHAYYKSSGTATWTTAKTNCESWGAHLMTINSVEENNIAPGDATYWIGMSDATTEGDIRWVTGEPLNYTNWATAEPNGDAEDYMMIYNTKKWNDGSATGPFSYLVEYPGTILDGKVINGTSFSFKDVNLEPSSTYYWIVVPQNQYGRPWVSDYWGFTTGSTGTAPGTISAITPTNAATGVAINAPLTWTAPSGSPTEYYAYLGTNNTCDYAGNYTDLGFWNGHHYFRHTLYSSTWPQAEAYAELDGGLWTSSGTGYLATIGSANEKAKLAETAGNWRWLGGNDRVTPNIWKWSNGDPWVYTSWASGEPNNGTTGQYYVVNNWITSGEWDDQDSSTSNLYYFLMETVPNIADGTKVTAPSYTPPLLRFNTTYYWSAVGSNNYGMANDTQRWSFTTGNGKVVNPTPANGAINVTSNAFDWDDVGGASSYTFYLGTASGTWDLVNGTSCPTSDYTYGGPSNINTPYYWRVDTVTPLETVTGNIWSFTTANVYGVEVTSQPSGANIAFGAKPPMHQTPYTFYLTHGQSATYTVSMTDYDWTLDPLFDSNVVSNISSNKHINFIGTFHHADIANGIDYIGEPGIAITGVAGNTTAIAPPAGYVPTAGAVIMTFSGTVTSDLTVMVPAGVWYVAAYYSGQWNLSVPFPVNGPGSVVFANVPFGAKGDVPVIIDTTPTLPVELSSFTAVLTADYFVNLTWVTESETDALGFNVYRSESNDVADAVRINSNIIAATNTSQQHTYTVIDQEVEANAMYYYWLESTELNNSSTFHGPNSVTVGSGGEVVPPPVIATRTGINKAYPNPFNPRTQIDYSVKDQAQVTLAVFNHKGQRIRTLVNAAKASGNYRVIWDGNDSNGVSCSSGIYYVRMQTVNSKSSCKIVLLK